jgi:hypothetical protein
MLLIVDNGRCERHRTGHSNMSEGDKQCLLFVRRDDVAKDAAFVMYPTARGCESPTVGESGAGVGVVPNVGRGHFCCATTVAVIQSGWIGCICHNALLHAARYILP